jgi:DNA-binding beta-propeller fold protein YncE
MMWGSSGTGDGQFNEPSGLAVDGQNQIFVVDRKNSRLQKFDSSGTFLAQWGGQGDQDGQFQGIGFAAVDSQGNVYVNDLANNRVTVSKFDNNGQFLSKSVDLTCDFQRETFAPGEVGAAGGMWVDLEGNLYLADFAQGRICEFDQNGTFISGWGEKGIEAGQLLAPIGIVGDNTGSFYVLDYSSGQVQKFQVK